jgi:hypothetical protein
LRDVVASIRRLANGPPEVDASIPGVPMVMATTVYEPAPLDVGAVEQACGVVLPPDLIAFWTLCGGARLFEDVAYGQWGLVLFTPAQVSVQSPLDTAAWSEYIAGDLVIGKFIGDLDRVVIRADARAADFGEVVISPQLGARSQWHRPARSMGEFLARYLSAKGAKYWEPSAPRE